MVNREDSIPKRGEKYLEGQDILWTQFNDINFYVEDIEQENFYLVVLRKLFPEIKINRIFPRGGKEPVLVEARKSLKNKNKVFILDLDFDEILNKKVSLKNVFYLKKYSIENYLIEKEAILEFIKEENTKIKTVELKKLDLLQFYKECHHLLSNLTTNFLLINKFELGVNYLKIDPKRDCDFTSIPCCLKPGITTPYYTAVENALKEKKPRLKYQRQLLKLKKFFKDISNGLINIPGKYIINLLKTKLRKMFSISQMTFESFTYRLAKNCQLRDLEYLKLEILSYAK
jgi:hypothetical protein